MIIPITVLSSVGLFFGVALSISAKLLHVKVNKKIAEIDEVLPGTNCGACGYPGCMGFAIAVANGEASTAGCLAGGAEVAMDVAGVMGTDHIEVEETIAVVNCKGGYAEATERAVYEGIHDCHAAELIGNGTKECSHGCLGLGSCVKTCSYDAIIITDNGLAVIDPDKCTGCEGCLTSCPRNLITMMPKDRNIFLACNNHDRGAKVKKYCSVGCTGCTLCVKAATVEGSVTMDNFLPVLDYQKEDNFVAAAYKCPSNCFTDLAKARPKANISTKCTNCGDCLTACPVKGAIIAPEEGVKGARYQVDKLRCIGCGICVPACHDDAITMWGSLGYNKDI